MMTWTFLALCFSILFPLFMGYLCLMCILPRIRLTFPLAAALSYGLGLGLTTMWMLILGLFSVKLTAVNITIPLTLFATGLFVACKPWQQATTHVMIPKRSDDQSQRVEWKRLFPWMVGLVLLTYIGINLHHAFWRSLNVPVATWDAIATVAFKAKIFYFEQGFPPLSSLPHRTYPLFVPLAEAWTALSLGTWNDQFIKIIFPAGLTSFLLIVYAYLRTHTGRTWSLLGCALLVSGNLFFHHATISYRDFYLMYFNGTTIILLLLWNRVRYAPLLFLAGLFAGFASFVKLEGTAFLGIYYVLLIGLCASRINLDLRGKFKAFLTFVLPSLLVCLTFHVYKISQNAVKEGTGVIDKTNFDFTPEKLSFIPNIILQFFDNLFYSGNWGITWFVLVLSYVHIAKKRTNSDILWLTLGMAMFFLLYGFMALFTANYVWIAGELNITTLSRLILHFFPLSVILIVLLNSSEGSGEKGQASARR